MQRLPLNAYRQLFGLITLLILLMAGAALAQGTAFTYQGKLTDAGSPATGQYDFQFSLFDTNTVGTGTQLGTVQTLTSVAVSNGIFSVQLDFGACPTCFNGAARFLEIAVRPTGGGSFTSLSPRQPLSSTPYAIRSLNAAAADGLSVACVNCVTSSQIGSVSGSAVSGTIPVASVPPGSGSYIQNTTTPQASSNFNISGNGTAGGTLAGGIVNTTSQYNLGGNRVLSVTGAGSFANSNTFAGVGAGAANVPNGVNGTGILNSFFGFNAGLGNTTGFSNSFSGYGAGQSNTTGSLNSFFGRSAGNNNTLGGANSFFGYLAGTSNTTENQNTFIGVLSDGTAGITNATAIGFRAKATQSNTLVLGSVNGVNGAVTDISVGIGTTNPTARLHAEGGSSHGVYGSSSTNDGVVGVSASGKGLYGSSGTNDGVVGLSSSGYGVHGVSTSGYGVLGYSSSNVGVYGISNTNVGVYAFSSTNDGVQGISSTVGVRGESISSTGYGVYGISSGYAGYFSGNVYASGTLTVGTLGAAGDTTICRNPSNQIATCSSSLRYKTDVRTFSSGLDFINRLRPIAFTWKQGGQRDLGLAAEEVAQVEPLLVTHSDKGEVEGVKYDRINVLLINAVNEQQAQIKAQQEQIRQQQREIETLKKRQQDLEALKSLVCLDHPAAAVCK